MKNVYKVLELRAGFSSDKEHFFATQKLALNWLSKEITKRETANKNGLPDRDYYDSCIEKKIVSLFKNKKWAKIAPYYALYLSKEKLHDK